MLKNGVSAGTLQRCHHSVKLHNANVLGGAIDVDDSIEGAVSVRNVCSIQLVLPVDDEVHFG